MAASIKLYPIGKKNQKIFRVVVAERRSKRDGKYIESIGLYNPHTDPYTFKIKKDRLNYWLSKGALLSEGIKKLIHSKRFDLT